MQNNIDFDVLLSIFENIKDKNDVGMDDLTIRASKVHKFLRVESRFDEWFSSCSERMKLTKGEDFIEIESSDAGVEYLISSNLTMHFCMITDCDVSMLIKLFLIESSNLQEKVVSSQNQREFVKNYTEYVEHKNNARKTINSGL